MTPGMVNKQHRLHGKNLRKGRFSQPGRIYLLTTVTHMRQPIFENFSCARLLIQTLIKEQSRVETLCFVIMPDHLHWLVQLREDVSLEVIMQSVKSVSSHKINAFFGNRGSIWQRGYHDHALRREEDIKALARYVIANPVRTGLAGSVMEYPHWDAVWMV
jgi:REP element-mobilizing transposase RayT